MKVKIFLWVILSIVLAVITPIYGDDIPGDVSIKKVSDFITSENSINLDKIRKSGYEGPLDLSGYDVVINPHTGEPQICNSVIKSNNDDPDDWMPAIRNNSEYP